MPRFYNSTTSNSSEHGHHKWVGPVGHRLITVDVNGLGDFRSVQDAVDSVPDNNRMNVLILIRAGRDTTVIEWHDRACDRGPDGQQLRTYHTASVSVLAPYFSARNISFKACGGGKQGGVRISATKPSSPAADSTVRRTLSVTTRRHYFKECYIEGSIDFIFGNGRSMYKDCELHSIATRFGSIAAQGRNSPDEKTGFAFLNCRVTGTGPLYVGRAMGQYSRIVFSYTYFDDIVSHGGWDDWDHVSNKNKTAFFGVYKCDGPGAAAVRGVSWARELDYDSAHPFLAKSFVNGRHWIDPSDA
ncbi:hypothetical protein DH2020_005296 [Rehmannia glutinosa]|uniref:Pectinesterase n=1 Tax=Rehmannia glutinosa TaxID=99300 RepID=A0ABR0XFS2_REHGL